MSNQSVQSPSILAKKTGTTKIGHTVDNTNGRTLAQKVNDTISVKDFGVVGDGSDEFVGISAAWDYALANNKNLFFPAGTYSSGTNNMPFKNPTYPASTLLDCGGICIFGEGEKTILMSDSVDGADVLNLYSVKNISIRNMKVTAALSGSSGAGSNGISIVGGFDNIVLDHIWMEDLPYVDKSSYLDGGKGLTIQTGSPSTDCGTVKATNIFVKRSVYGFGLEIDLANWATKKHGIEIDVIAEDCYEGVVYSAGAAVGALSVGMNSGLTVNATLINCQKNVACVRAHGVEINANIVSTKSLSNKRLNPSGGAWSSTDNKVVGLLASYVKNSRLKIVGDVGECDYKAEIGGITAGSSGLNGATEFSDIYIDLGGQAVTSDFNIIDSGGNSIRKSNIVVTDSTTATALPALIYLPSNDNIVTKGSSSRINAPIVNGALTFAYTDGITSYNEIERDGLGVFVKQTGGSSATIQSFGVKDDTGVIKMAIMNDGGYCTDSRNTSSAVGTITGVMPIHDTSGTLVGYIPIHDTFTP